MNINQIKITEERLIQVENNLDSISSPSAELVTLHGLGASKIWFKELSEILAKNNTATWLFDLPAFGDSIPRGNINSYKDWLNSIKQVWALANNNNLNNKNNNSRKFLLGHSLGGVLALASLKFLDPKPAGLILTVPGLLSHPKSFPFFKFFIPTLKKYFQDSSQEIETPFPEELKIAIEAGSLDEKFLTKKVTAKLFIEITKIIFYAWGSVFKLSKIPLLMILSDNDTVCTKQASEIFFGLTNSSNKSLVSYKNFGHDLFINSEAFLINEKIANWIGQIIQT